MRFGIDVEPQGVSRLAVSRTRLIRASVGHHDGDFVIIRVNSFFHQTILHAAAAYSEAALYAMSGDNGRPCRPSRNLSMRDAHCEGDQVEKIDQASDVVVAHDPSSTRLSRQIVF